VFIVHVETDAPNELTRHYFKRLISDRKRNFLAFFSFFLSVACLGSSSHLLATGVNAARFSKFAGLIEGISVIPLPVFVILVSGVLVLAYTIGSVQCCRSMSSTYRSDNKAKHKWMAVYSSIIYGGLIALIIIILITVLYELLTNSVFRVQSPQKLLF
jgi:hypothetical protein